MAQCFRRRWAIDFCMASCLFSFLLVCSIAIYKGNRPATAAEKWTLIHFHEFKGFVEIRRAPNYLIKTSNLRSTPNADAKCGAEAKYASLDLKERLEQRS